VPDSIQVEGLEPLQAERSDQPGLLGTAIRPMVEGRNLEARAPLPDALRVPEHDLEGLAGPTRKDAPTHPVSSLGGQRLGRPGGEVPPPDPAGDEGRTASVIPQPEGQPNAGVSERVLLERLDRDPGPVRRGVNCAADPRYF
jgi:hypothetical protein